MANLTEKQLKDYLKFIEKCVKKNFNITPEEQELLVQIQIACSLDKETKNLIDSLMCEQNNSNRYGKIEEYLGKNR